MARFPLQDARAPARQKSLIATFPPPIGGWNTRDALPNMPVTDAPVLNNMLCQPSQVVQRSGSTLWASGLSGNCNTLMPYNSSTVGSKKLFAAAGSSIYDVTSTNGGAVGTAVVTGLGSSWWQYVNFATSAGQFLVAVNGADSMQSYNGTWTATATLNISGGSSTLAMNTVIGIAAYETTLYFVPASTLGFYYQAAQSIFGTVTYFSLAAFCPRGGYLMAMATWTVDGGNGPQDYLVCFTSEGEVVVFQGLSFSTAVGQAGAMNMVGVYFVGRPMGRRCTFKFGGDLLLLTDRGIFPISAALQSATIDRRVAFTDKIEPSFVQNATALFGTNGFQIETNTQTQCLLINIPSTPPVQYVMQFQTRGWSQFLGWSAYCWLYYNGALYYGGANTVIEAFNSTADQGNAIVTACMPAFTQLKVQGQQKHVKLVRPYWESQGTFGYSIDGMVDYNIVSPTSAPTTASSFTAAVWDTAIWDTSQWGGGNVQAKQWSSVAAWPCVAFAPYFQTSSNSGAPGLEAYDILFTVGGVL